MKPEPGTAPAVRDEEGAHRALLREKVLASIGAMRACYREELAKDPDIENKMALSIEVRPSGDVVGHALMDAVSEDGSSQGPSLLSDRLANCLTPVVEGWKFPAGTWVGRADFGDIKAGPVGATPIVIAYWGQPPQQPGPAQSSTSKPEIQKIIRGHIDEARDCYETYVDGGAPSGLDVRIEVEFVIEPSGVVSSAKVVSGPEPRLQLGECLLGAIKTWRFRALPREKVIVRYPFHFVPPDEK